jgi:hypothetical protein
MQKGLPYFLISILTFTIGIFGATSYRNYQDQRDELMFREGRLRYDLYYLRRYLDLYAADKGELPQSLDDLVTGGYYGKIPFDPITNRRAWKIVVGNDPNSVKGRQGIVNVHSTSLEVSSRGTPYTEW